MEKDKLKVFKLKQELVQKIVELSPFLPNNSLDELIDGLGGPSQVAEVRTMGHTVVVAVYWTFSLMNTYISCRSPSPSTKTRVSVLYSVNCAHKP